MASTTTKEDKEMTTDLDLKLRPRLWSMPEVAAHLSTTQRHVRRLVEEKRIPYLKVGHFLRFDPDELDHWLDEQRVVTCNQSVGTRQSKRTSG
jgi:excisionase family DNA binding protein